MTEEVESMGFEVRERLPVYPEFINDEFIDPAVLELVRKDIDDSGFIPRETA